ncbi:MAG: type II secretion system F family protein [Armatimonadetes bacterium]|nr:type II secretion system F family protein [Armatimonadota bacterium]
MGQADGDRQWMPRARSRPRDLIQLFRQMSVMLASGISLAQVLDNATEWGEDPRFGQVMTEVRGQVLAGHRLSHAMRQFPRFFPNLAVAMVQVGEMNGQLVDAQGRLADWLERDYELRRRVASTLSYPLFALGLTAVLTLIIFYTALPGFVQMFSDMDIEVPLPTRILIAITALIRSPLAWAAFCGLAVVGISSARAYLETPRGRMTLFRTLLRIPMLGRLLQSASLARFAAASEAMLGSGTGLLSVLRLSAEVCGNPLLAEDVDRLLQHVRLGGSLSEYMATRPSLYPSVVVNLISSGEEAAMLAPMFGAITHHYERDVEYLTQVLSSMLEPLLMATLALVVGFIVISIFLPMYGYIGKLAP